MSSPIGELVYGTDAVGLRTALGGSYARTDLPAAVASTDYDAANRLTEWGAQSFTYDDTGNMTGDGTSTYGWNARGELVSLSGGGTSAVFEYDPFGRRASFTLDNSEKRYLYDGASVVQELNGGGTPTADLLSGLGLDDLFAVTDGDGTHSLVSDALGSTLALTDEEGESEAEYAYEPFGKATESGGGSTAYQYTGRDNDQTGLQYSRARYYDPTLGRFISEDPLGFAGGDLNLYAYVGDSPLSFVDPQGTHTATVEGPIFRLPGLPSVPPGTGAAIRVRLPSAGALSLGYGAGYAARKYFSAPEGASDSLLSRFASEETGTGGPGTGDHAAAQRFARTVKLPADNPAVVNRGLSVDEFISRFRAASIRRKFPGEFLSQTVEQALRSGNPTVRKLLTSREWAK